MLVNNSYQVTIREKRIFGILPSYEVEISDGENSKDGTYGKTFVLFPNARIRNYLSSLIFRENPTEKTTDGVMKKINLTYKVEKKGGAMVDYVDPSDKRVLPAIGDIAAKIARNGSGKKDGILFKWKDNSV
ncbi:MAG: hypothetical protein GXO64_02675 [Candidatus Micrarchaeota archaeon]|nr:hypothetical protein [Candidatus Micrarchaeota archaeon]